MIHVLFGSLSVFWLLMGSALAQVKNEEPSSLAGAIVNVLADGTSEEAIASLIEDCGPPRIIIMPPRPGEPLQETLVSRLGDTFASIGIDIVDGERALADQSREADLAYAQSNDAAAATRILLARTGDYEMTWSMDVAMEGPMEIYGVETWEAKIDLRATLVDLLTGNEIDSIAVTHASRQQTRERSLDQAVESVVTSLADDAVLPILRNWYGVAAGDGIVQVEISGDSHRVDELQKQLISIAGVRSVTRSLPAEPPRLLVHGNMNAMELSTQLGQGDPVSCRKLVIESNARPLWVIWAGLIAMVILFRLLKGSRRTSSGS
jgi:hypothetical protein